MKKVTAFLSLVLMSCTVFASTSEVADQEAPKLSCTKTGSGYFNNSKVPVKYFSYAFLKLKPTRENIFSGTVRVTTIKENSTVYDETFFTVTVPADKEVAENTVINISATNDSSQSVEGKGTATLTVGKASLTCIAK